MLLSTTPSSSSPGPLLRAFADNSQDGLLATPTPSSSSRLHPLSALFAQAQADGGRIQIQNAKPPPTLKPNYVPQNITLVARSLRALLAGQDLNNISLGQLYALVDSLVRPHGAGPDLYERLQMEGQRAAVELARRLKDQTAAPSRQWLESLATAWKHWLARARLVKDVVTPLDVEYIHPRQSEFQPTHDILLAFFKHFVLDDDVIKQKACDAVTTSVDAERRGDAVEYPRTHSTILALFLRLDSYPRLQEVLLSGTRAFYSKDATLKTSGVLACSTPVAGTDAAQLDAYLTHAQKCLQDETQRSQWLLDSPTERDDLIAIVRHKLINERVKWITAGLPALLSQDPPALPTLAKLCNHLASANLLEALASALFEHIVRVGFSIVTPPLAVRAGIKQPSPTESDRETFQQATGEEEALIDNLLAFARRIDAAVEGPFARHAVFVHRRTDGFEKVVNSRTGGGKVAELCAKYLDAKLKSGNRTMTDEEFERCLDEALALFRYTHAKDMFEEFYKRHFAKRLLLNRCASSDAEQSMLLKLKDECGAEFTHKLETMLKDITLSDEMMKAYAASSAAIAVGAEDFELNVKVLTQSQWPTYPLVEVRIPPAMAVASEHFRTFYSARNAGRRLHWAHSLGTCTVRARFPRCGEKELHVSEFQAIVLLLFNGLESGERLSYTAIREQTAMDDVELRRTLQSLACGQIPTRVLRKEPQGRGVADTDQFHINEAFKNERHRIRINQIQLKETKEEQASTEHRVLLDRELVLQAASVRILKSHKQLKHAELLQEVVDSIKNRFQVDVGEIKKTFEILIEKDYMERVEGERGVYRYVA